MTDHHPSGPTVEVRPAAPEDTPAVAESLADAFADYSWTRWALPDDDYHTRLRAMQLYFLDHVGLPHGRVWVTDDLAAAAVWTCPDTEVPAEVFTAPELTGLYGDRAAPVGRADALLAPHRPTEPCWFLATVGVRRAAQGHGLGGRVIAAGLRAADESGRPAFLETSEPRNVRFYQRLGFTVTAEVRLPDDAPVTWCMLREPRDR
ncbi:GNAT family N-acetyltransferase [Marinitenerispora sediminis]|uniref:N-acetyltransferase n=1 Tax=Marinitenerispora sediminis TaxID=1931232 RepID=A0A368T9M1_9ACTN|nr:GNAT family N-acetyltransferase [Marinitenerispora sediminis]RCV52794.1 N-acetyltransferase [Marinitenerispora sediminis]RCV59899.1 N-acetyltransferase [Marinitenerispora sediminis]RCV61315.1 N-acetyltransferase [Marinitenerispora sediminis]